jgi:hypothetical protein
MQDDGIKPESTLAFGEVTDAAFFQRPHRFRGKPETAAGMRPLGREW